MACCHILYACVHILLNKDMYEVISSAFDVRTVRWMKIKKRTGNLSTHNQSMSVSVTFKCCGCLSMWKIIFWLRSVHCYYDINTIKQIRKR